MARDLNTVATWTPSPEQQAVANRFAMGYSWNRAAALSRVSWQTCSNWRNAQGGAFERYAEELRQEVMLAAEPQFAGIIERAQSLLLRVGDEPGDLSPTAELATWAERILSKTLWPVLIARGMAQSGIAIDRGQAVRLATGGYRAELDAGGAAQ